MSPGHDQLDLLLSLTLLAEEERQQVPPAGPLFKYLRPPTPSERQAQSILIELNSMPEDQLGELIQ